MDHTVVVEGGGYPRYVRDVSTERGYLVYARSEGLLAAPFDEASLKLTGQPVPVVDDVVTNLSGGAHFDISANGTLAYVPGTVGESDRDLMWVTLEGKATLARRGNMGRFFALSPDGTRVARNNITGQREVWIDDLVRGTSTRLTNAPNNFSSVWSRDGLWLAFARGAPKVDIYRRRVDQTGPEEQLTSLPQGTAPTGFSPDGNLLAFYENNPLSSYDIWVMTLPAAAPSGATTVISTPAVRPFVKTNFTENGAVFSPDGRWLAYQSNESGRFEIYVRSFPDGERTVQVSNEGGIGPIWSANGRDLFFRGTDGMMMAAAVKLAPDIELSKPRVLFDARRYENSFGVSPDGQRLLMMPLIPTEGSAAQIHVILNFISELRARVR